MTQLDLLFVFSLSTPMHLTALLLLLEGGRGENRKMEAKKSFLFSFPTEQEAWPQTKVQMFSSDL